MRFFWISTGIGLLALSSFWSKPKHLEPRELINWIENPENGLKKTREFNNILFSVQQKTPEYIALKEEGMEPNEKLKFQSFIQSLGSLEYYTLTLEHKEGLNLLKNYSDNNEAYSKIFNYFSFKVQEDLFLVSQADTLPCLIIHSERNYGLSPALKIHAAFQKPKDFSPREFIFYDKNFGAGKLKFLFQNNDPSTYPKLKE